MNRSLLTTVCVWLLLAFASVPARQIGWKDPSPHTVRFISVDENVQLEVLDWGGSGPALVMLAGLGVTAHVYDDFALRLTSRYHVLGVTRRAHGRSSAPPTGYGFTRLAEDVVRVIEATGISRPIIVGHSFAGEEMHVLGARYSEKIAGLVYVDAAFDRGDDADSEAYAAVARTLPAPPGPEPADLASFAALRSYLERTQGGAGPEAHLRARFLTNADGTVGGQWAPDPSIRQEIQKEIRAAYTTYNPERIRVPALAIYAVPKSVDDLMRRGSSDRGPLPSDFIARAAVDPLARERVEKLFELTRARVEAHANWFRAFAPQARVSEVAGPHMLFLTNTEEVVLEIDRFVASLQDKR